MRKQFRFRLFILSILISLGIFICAFAQHTQKTIVNGGNYTDTSGKIINAHGGGFLKVGKYYYWIGENRHGNVLVSCYRSTDLINWEFRSDLITRQSNPELAEANIERPKVIYNEKTKKFVMWMHYEKYTDYSLARAAVAVSDDIEKPFTYQKSFRPFGNMSRDCTLFKDTDGSAYFLSAARENYDMMVYKLTDDYLDAKEHLLTLWPGGHREAPALVKRGEYYFLITSGCTGWAPNQAKYAYSKSIRGPWSDLTDIGNATTFDSQSTYILPVEGNETTSYLYVGDRWDGRQYFNSKYIYLPLTFKGATTMELNWKDSVAPDLKSGRID
jgi:Beta-xylosidase